ncbi:MAG TPA: universal stress protein [Gammaproteobacteria bacterium]
MKLHRIMVATKPWERGLPLAATHARQLAADARIELVSTVFDAAIGAGCDRGEEPARQTHQRTIAAARVELERVAGSMRTWGATVTTRIVWGTPPYEAILAAAEEWHADLLVVGAHERATLHSRLTDTDWQLMRRARCPLLLVKNGWFNGYRTILAAVDPLHAHDEPFGLDQAVLAEGRCFARVFGSKLRAVYAYPGNAAFALASAVEVTPGVLYGSENIEELHRRAVTELVAQFGVCPGEIDLVEGSAPQAIADAAMECRAELVVVGATQRRGPSALAHGSTAELIAAEVPCDVLIVPLPDDTRVETGPRSKVG